MEKKCSKLDYSKLLDKYLRPIAENAKDILFVANGKGHFLFVSPAFEEILGYNYKEVINIPYRQFIHPDDIHATESVESDLKEGKEVWYFKNRYKVKNKDEYRWLSWTTINKDGTWYGVARDITKEIELSEKLDSAQKKLKIEIDQLKNLRSDQSYASTKLDQVIKSLYNISLSIDEEKN